MKRRYFIFIFLLVVVRLLLFRSTILDYDLPIGKHEFEATVCQDPKRFFHKQELALCSNLGDFKILVQTETFPRFKLYQKLDLSCNLKEPANFSDFDYKKYLNKQGIYLVCLYPKITDTKDIYYDNADYFSWEIKENIANKFNRYLLEPGAGLSKAMILGYRTEAHPDLKSGLEKAGLAHILAISGLHISILTGLLLWLLRKVKFKYLIISIFLLGYLFILGFSISASRAVVMTILLFTSRDWFSFQSRLLLVAALMLLIDPGYIYEISFQLSFTAVAGLAWFYPILDEKISRLINITVLRLRMNKRLPFDFDWQNNRFIYLVYQACLASLSVNIVLWPMLSFYFEGYNILSVIINLLILPVLPILLASLYIGIIIPAVLYLSHWPLKYVELLSYINIGYLEFQFSRELMLVYYLILAILVFRITKNKPLKPVFCEKI